MMQRPATPMAMAATMEMAQIMATRRERAFALRADTYESEQYGACQ